MNLIVSADENWAIGSNNQLLVRIPDDMHFFRELTQGKVVVMGRKTRESLPNGILENRVNIVLTHDRHYKAGNAIDPLSCSLQLFLSAAFSMIHLRHQSLFRYHASYIYSQNLPN